jgi:nucleotide-binding universal stress UspA family protein
MDGARSPAPKCRRVIAVRRQLRRGQVNPYEAIIDTARKMGCDAIVRASHGRRGVSAIVLGSETVKVLTHG